MEYEKGSFSIVPNRQVIKGQEAFVQSVYFWICSFADQKGLCFPSIPTLSKCAGCSESSVRRAIEKLEEIGILMKEQRKSGEVYMSNVYQIVLVSDRQEGGVPQTPGVVSQGTHNYNQSNITIEYSDESQNKSSKEKKDTTYVRIFELWGKYPLNWKVNRTEIQAAKNLLEEHGLEDCKEALDFYKKHKHEEFCPQILKPSDLDRKRAQLMAYNNKI